MEKFICLIPRFLESKIRSWGGVKIGSGHMGMGDELLCTCHLLSCQPSPHLSSRVSHSVPNT